MTCPKCGGADVSTHDPRAGSVNYLHVCKADGCGHMWNTRVPGATGPDLPVYDALMRSVFG